MLPVVRGGDENACFFASPKNLDFWQNNMITVHRLTRNQRLHEGEQQYMKQLKCYGTGVGRINDLYVRINEEMWVPNEDGLIEFVFRDALSNPMERIDEIKGAAILCPL